MAPAHSRAARSERRVQSRLVLGTPLPVRLIHAIDGSVWHASIVNLSEAGCAILVSKGVSVLPPRKIFGKLEVRFSRVPSGHRHGIYVRARHCSEVRDAWRIGLQFLDVDGPSLERVRGSIVSFLRSEERMRLSA
ncbi:MAG TPA: PilZ domain-containing protein [Planctomycetota bacterium]|nr:PilZ domain-containing protein [Planctomycetota bacterium]